MKHLRRLIAITATAIFCLLARPAIAQDDAIRAQVQAATDNAISQLRGEILSTRISPTLSVGHFLDQTDSIEALNDTIERAEQIGGPRWIDDQTCQVQLQISGARIAYALVSVAAAHPKRSPLPADVLEQQLSDWKDRTFSATGTSFSAAKLQVLRPADDGNAWASVPDEARRQAVADARQDAVQHIVESIRFIELAPGTTIDNLLVHEKARQAIYAWLNSRPVTGVQFKENLQVELTVAAPPEDLADVVINSAQSLGVKIADVDHLRQEFAKHMPLAVGRAEVKQIAEKSPATQPAAIVLPQQPPTWLGQLIQAEATAPPANSTLRTKHAAESSASQTLRERVEAMQLTHELSVGQAAKQDSRIADAVDRALLRARVYKVEYRADGSVMVRMMIDSRDLWYELCQIGN